MKRILFLSLSALTLSLLATPAFANEIVAANQNSFRSIQKEITPFNLVARGYQGSFVDLGIPSNHAFINAVRRGQITATDLIESAIASGRLSPTTINDRAYLNNVKVQLNNLNIN